MLIQREGEGVIAVFGATGSIGSEICKTLSGSGMKLVGFARDRQRLEEMQRNDLIAEARPASLSSHDEMLSSFALSHKDRLAGIVYAVGDCPQGGFERAIARCLPEIGWYDFQREFTIQVLWLQAVLFWLVPRLRPFSHVVVINSNITAYSKVETPAWLNAGHYAAAKAAQETLVDWWKKIPDLGPRKVFFHIIKPPAVDTPFYEGAIYRPPSLMPVERVARTVLDCFALEESSTWAPTDEFANSLVRV